jgi:hypothetical protein
LEGYYDGIEGARRLMKELDHLLQHVVNSVGRAEALNCSIELRVEGGECASLERSYRSGRRRHDVDGETAAKPI